MSERADLIKRIYNEMKIFNTSARQARFTDVVNKHRKRLTPKSGKAQRYKAEPKAKAVNNV